MENWKDYVAVQEAEDLDNLVLVYMTGKDEGFTLHKEYLLEEDFNLNEQTVSALVERTLSGFPVATFNDFPYEDEKLRDNAIGNHIAKISRRGQANIKWKNVLYYKGNHDTDSPLIVAKLNDRYHLFKHPDFDKYGVVYEDNR